MNVSNGFKWYYDSCCVVLFFSGERLYFGTETCVCLWCRLWVERSREWVCCITREGERVSEVLLFSSITRERVKNYCFLLSQERSDVLLFCNVVSRDLYYCFVMFYHERQSSSLIRITHTYKLLSSVTILTILFNIFLQIDHNLTILSILFQRKIYKTYHFIMA